MAGPSSTISLISIVDVGIVNDIVGEIVTCGRVFRVRRHSVRVRDSPASKSVNAALTVAHYVAVSSQVDYNYA